MSPIRFANTLIDVATVDLFNMTCLKLAVKGNKDKLDLLASTGHCLFFFLNRVHSREKLWRAATACTVALTPGGSIAEIQILFSFQQSDGSSNSLVTSQLEHRNTSIYKFHPHFQGF